MPAFCLPFGKGYQNFSDLLGDDAFARDRLKVRPHSAWGLRPSQQWPFGSGGIYCKAKLGTKKAKTHSSWGPEPSWDGDLLLPYDGERIVYLTVMCHFRGRTNEVLGSCSFLLSGIPPEGLLTDLTLRGPQSIPSGFLSVSIKLELAGSSQELGLSASSIRALSTGVLATNLSADGRPHVVAGAAAPVTWGRTANAAAPVLHDLTLDDEEPGERAPALASGPESADARRQRAVEAAARRQASLENRGIGDLARVKALAAARLV